MISLLIDYLINQPSQAASPMALALNVPGLLTELGGVSSINFISTRNQDGNPPYVRLYDKGTRIQDAKFTNGGSYQEVQILVIECAAYGPTDLLATQRADYLKRAVRGKIMSLIGTFHSGVPGPATDLAGSAATDNIASVSILPGLDEPTPSGPGADTDNPRWETTRKLQIGVRVYFGKP